MVILSSWMEAFMPIKSFDCLSYKGIYKYDVVEDLITYWKLLMNKNDYLHR